jgi:hypothetical protein
VPGSIFVSGGATSVKIAVTGVSPGSAAIHASAPNYLDTSANLTIN